MTSERFIDGCLEIAEEMRRENPPLATYATIAQDARLVTEVSIMNSKQFRKALEELGLKQGEAAEFLDVSIRSVNGYANDWPIPKQTAMLLRLMIKHGFKPEDVK